LGSHENNTKRKDIFIPLRLRAKDISLSLPSSKVFDEHGETTLGIVERKCFGTLAENGRYNLGGG